MSERKLSKEELQEFYDKVQENPYYRPYLTLRNKMYEVCDSFDHTTIDITGEDATFKNFTEFSKTIRKIVEDMESMKTKLSPAEAAKVKAAEKLANANAFSLESMINQSTK